MGLTLMWGQALVYWAAGNGASLAITGACLDCKSIPLMVPSLLITCMEGFEEKARFLNHLGQDNI